MFSKSNIFKAIAALVVSLALASPALANSTHPREGKDGNNVVCNGVPSKAMLMYYIKGGNDACGHRDIAAIWKRQGITVQVAQMMHLGTVCSTGGFTSSGRQHGPKVSLDHAISVNGSTVYLRPLAVWGFMCYKAWIGQTEDGQTVAILVGCGNGESSSVPPRHHKVARKPKKHNAKKPVHKPAKVACVTTSGTPLYSPLPGGISVVNGVCTSVSVNTNVTTCTDNKTPIRDSSGVVINCIDNTNINTITVPVTVIVTPPVAPPPCNCTTTPPPATPTPCNCDVPTALVNHVQEIDRSNYMTSPNTIYSQPICATVTAPKGDKIVVTFTADWGTFAAPVPLTSSGTQQVCDIYTSPTEVVTDTAHVVVADITTGKSCKPADSNGFGVVEAAPAPPNRTEQQGSGSTRASARKARPSPDGRA